jgi:hypothetical protein
VAVFEYRVYNTISTDITDTAPKRDNRDDLLKWLLRDKPSSPRQDGPIPKLVSWQNKCSDLAKVQKALDNLKTIKSRQALSEAQQAHFRQLQFLFDAPLEPMNRTHLQHLSTSNSVDWQEVQAIKAAVELKLSELKGIGKTYTLI